MSGSTGGVLKSGLKIDWISRQAEPVVFDLRLADDRGARPVQVKPVVVPIWSRRPGIYDHLLTEALQMRATGRRRLRLYCPKSYANQVRMTVHGGSTRCLGRRYEPMIETLTWVQGHDQRLRYHYDRPEAEIMERTRFFDVDGRETDPPVWLPAEGRFHHPQPVTGALVVAYRPGFSLYEIDYDTGVDRISPEWFREMQYAWLAGNIQDVAIPPVRVVAIAGERAAQTTFPRAFWPNRSTVRGGYEWPNGEPVLEPEGDGYRIRSESGADLCWRLCRQSIKPDGGFLSESELQAVRECVQQGRNPIYHYVETKRTVRTERIYSVDDAEVYVDVERQVELVMKQRRVDAGPCPESEPAPCCPELVFRFRSDD